MGEFGRKLAIYKLHAARMNSALYGEGARVRESDVVGIGR